MRISFYSENWIAQPKKGFCVKGKHTQKCKYNYRTLITRFNPFAAYSHWMAFVFRFMFKFKSVKSVHTYDVINAGIVTRLWRIIEVALRVLFFLQFHDFYTQQNEHIAILCDDPNANEKKKIFLKLNVQSGPSLIYFDCNFFFPTDYSHISSKVSWLKWKMLFYARRLR